MKLVGRYSEWIIVALVCIRSHIGLRKSLRQDAAAGLVSILHVVAQAKIGRYQVQARHKEANYPDVGPYADLDLLAGFQRDRTRCVHIRIVVLLDVIVAVRGSWGWVRIHV